MDFRVLEFSKENKRILLSHSIVFKEEMKQEKEKKQKATKKAMKKIEAQQKQSTLGDLDELSNLKKDLDSKK